MRGQTKKNRKKKKIIKKIRAKDFMKVERFVHNNKGHVTLNLLMF